MRPELWDFQADVIGRARAAYAGGARRVLLQAPTGAGKTTIAAEIARLAVARGNPVLFLAHRRRLITQVGERLGQFGLAAGYLMSGLRGSASAPVQVASRDTLLSRVVRNDWRDPPPAKLVVVDECHTCLSDEYQRLLSLWPDARFLGLTATPARADGRGLGAYFDALVCTAPASRLIADGRLVPVRCFAPDHAKTRRSKRKLSGDAVGHWLRLAAGRPTILFASKVEKSVAMADRFNARGVAAEHLDASSPDAEREAVVARVRSGETKVLCNVGIYTEGVDIPELSCCVLLRLAGSYVLWAQCIGRVMRAHPSKADALVIDHAGAVLEHGFPDEDVEWTLDESETVDARNAEARKAGKRREAVVCHRCGLAYFGKPPCPGCGALPFLSRKAKEPCVQRELLVEVERGFAPGREREERVRYWHRCLAVMANRGAKARQALGMYHSKYDGYPADDFPNVPRGCQWDQRVADLFPNYVRGRR